MDHMRIIRRAFETTRLYRALWVFGILIALTVSRGGGGNGGGNSSRSGTPGNFPNPPFHMPTFTPQMINGFIGLGIGLICLFIIIAVVLTVLRYISETALIRMVNGYEDSGEKVSVREGFRLGWSRSSFRLWLMDFGIGVIGFVIFFVLLAIAAAPLLVWLTDSQMARVIGTVVAVGLVILLIFLMIIAGAAISLLVKVAQRAIVLENLGVIDGLRRGWAMVASRLGDVIIMGLILFGIGLLYAIVMIPVALLLLVVGALGGGLPALLAGGITNIFAHGTLPWVIGAVVGLPIFLAVLAVPLIFVGGLFETFKSSTWTLTYREMIALATVRDEPREEPPVEPGPEPVL